MTLIYWNIHSSRLFGIPFFEIFYIKKSILLANKDSFISSLEIYIYFFVLSSCTSMISSEMLNRNSKRTHPCLVLNLRGQVYCFSPPSIILAVGFT